MNSIKKRNAMSSNTLEKILFILRILFSTWKSATSFKLLLGLRNLSKSRRKNLTKN